MTQISFKFSNNNKGFTLIELISVLLILGIVSATVISNSGTFTSSNDLAMEAELLKANLRYTQMMSMNTNGNEIWRINFPNSGEYTIQQYNGASWDDKVLPSQTSGATHELPNGITASSNPPIYYDIWGTPVISESNLNAQTDLSKLKITLSDGTNLLDVEVTKNTGFTFVP